jgi:general L-amino acid transport system permease protein
MAETSRAFVRRDMLPPALPPAGATGLMRWLRENLFSTPVNAVMTVVSVLVVGWLAQAVWPWLSNGVWTTTSLAACRDVLQGETGACFSVLSERWNQLLFGFKYPQDQYWRPALAFVLLFIAAAPVLFFKLPRQLLIVTAIYPFLAFWLIWGGSITVSVFAALGFVAAGVVFQTLAKQAMTLAALAGVVAAILVWWIGGQIDAQVMVLEPVASRDVGGFMLNMILGVVCVSLSLPIGILLALGRRSDMLIIKWICVIFIEFVRGVPLITLLFVANVVLGYFLPPEVTFDLILRVIIMITMFSAAYIAEVIRGGLAALPKGQYEAADSLGLDYAQAMRLIILPQALKISIPGIVNVAVGLFKDTTLVSVISMFDLVGMIRGPIQGATEWNGVYWELFGFAALLFFVVCYGISQYSQWLEQQLRTDHR